MAISVISGDYAIPMTSTNAEQLMTFYSYGFSDRAYPPTAYTGRFLHSYVSPEAQIAMNYQFYAN